MSFVLTDKAKYRLTGGVVFISLVVFTLPGLMKKSNQRFEENLSLSLKVPPKPKAPVMNIPSAQQVFSSVQLSKVATPKPKVAEREVKVELAKAESLVISSHLPSISMNESQPLIKQAQSDEKSKSISNHNYAVQLASFSHEANANFLVSRLKKLGYDAQWTEINSKVGTLYKVEVGPLKNKDKAVEVQKQLSHNMQLEGLIIKKG